MSKALVAGLVGIATGVVVGAWRPWEGGRPSAPPTLEGKVSAVDADRVTSALEAMAGRLDALAKSSEEARRTPDADAGARAAQLDARIEALEKAIADLKELVKSTLDVGARAEEAGVPPIPKNTSLLTTLCTDVVSSPKSLNSRHFLWTPVDVYRRYGRPDSINESGAMTYWVYNAETTSGAKYSLVFNFNAGYFLNGRCESLSESR